MALTTGKVLHSAFGFARNSVKINYLQRELAFLQCPSQSCSLFLLQKSHFHYQNIIQIQIQTKHGILLDALQRSRVTAADLEELNLKIPDELRRLKAGSLKWIFDVWPLPKKSLSRLTNPQHFRQDEEDKKGKSKTKKPKSGSEEQLHRVLDFLKSKNVAIRRLVKLPWLLSADPVILEESAKRVQKLLRINNFQAAISFVNLNESKLRETASVWANEANLLSRENELIGETKVQFHNRLDFMAYYLKCSPEDVSDMMAKVPKLMTLPLMQIKNYILCLVEGGVKPDYIVSDPWVFVRNLDSMRARLEVINENGISDFKPWVLRSSQRIYELYISRETAEMQLLGDLKDIGSFLQQKLDCDKQTATTMLAKVPSIKKATAVKLNEMIEFLYSQGFSKQHIVETPRILAHSVDTMAERLEEVMEYKDPLENLQILCRTKKEYRAVIRKWKRGLEHDDNNEDENLNETASNTNK